MCIDCNQIPCGCYEQPPTTVPCEPCTQTTVCKIKITAGCVTIGETNVQEFLSPTTLLNYIYASIVADPVQYAKFCALWAACP